MREADLIVEKAKSDEAIREELILKNELFILKCASSAARNYVSKNDDEWFVALGAFSEAIKDYSIEKGSFLNFAELSMRKSIYDFIKSQSRYADENLIDLTISDLKLDKDEDCISMETIVLQEKTKEVDSSLKLEIELVNYVLSSYGFTFFDLVYCSPNSRRSKKICMRVVEYIMGNPILVSNMKVNKSLQINTIVKNVRISKKVLEHYQKYIIAAVEIISGDYIYLSEYMRFIKEGLRNESCSC
jgi:RNA polymerase sigma factor